MADKGIRGKRDPRLGEVRGREEISLGEIPC